MKFLKVLGNKIRHALPVVSDFGVDVRSKWHPEYATDGDFVTALGRAAQDNDCYWNTTSKKIREYANGAFRDISTLWLKVQEDPITTTVSGGGTALRDYLATQSGKLFLADLTINLDEGNYQDIVISGMSFKNGAKLKIIGNDVQGAGRTFVKGARCNPGIDDASYPGLKPYYTITVSSPIRDTITVSVVDGVLPFDAASFIGNKISCTSKYVGTVEKTIIVGSSGGVIKLDSELPANHFSYEGDALTILPNRKVSSVLIYDFEGIIQMVGIYDSFTFWIRDYEIYNNGTYKESKDYHTIADVRFSRCAISTLICHSVKSSIKTDWNDDYQVALASSFLGNHSLIYGHHEFFWSYFGSTINLGGDVASPDSYSKTNGYAFFRKCNFVGRYSFVARLADTCSAKFSLCSFLRQNEAYTGNCGIIEVENGGEALIHLSEFKLIGTKIAADYGIWARGEGKIIRCYGTIVADLTNSFTNFGTAQRAENGGIIVSSSKDIFSGNTTNRSPASTATFGNNGGLSIIITE